jgi:hypothetical protein
MENAPLLFALAATTIAQKKGRNQLTIRVLLKDKIAEFGKATNEMIS